MRSTQAHVPDHDFDALSFGLPLPEVRYDLPYCTAAAIARSDSWPAVDEGIVALGRFCIARRLNAAPRDPEVLQVEAGLDLAALERLEKGVATTCGGIL